MRKVSGTNLQLKVWEALLSLEGRTCTSYSDVAQRIGVPNAVRAVANAVGANPIAWLIPCHRVLRKGGALGGYRWGIDRKRAMLAWERVGLQCCSALSEASPADAVNAAVAI
jgi:AraC family transcriptional regulator, regulatory protein of adaptative response / methylated-DNA-[protein]-cysteine methyltransferase